MTEDEKRFCGWTLGLASIVLSIVLVYALCTRDVPTSLVRIEALAILTFGMGAKIIYPAFKE